jgi:hypothetical protein
MPVVCSEGRKGFVLATSYGMTNAVSRSLLRILWRKSDTRFGFRLIVEEGLSHAVLTQTHGFQRR